MTEMCLRFLCVKVNCFRGKKYIYILIRYESTLKRHSQTLYYSFCWPVVSSGSVENHLCNKQIIMQLQANYHSQSSYCIIKETHVCRHGKENGKPQFTLCDLHAISDRNVENIQLISTIVPSLTLKINYITISITKVAYVVKVFEAHTFLIKINVREREFKRILGAIDTI